MWYVEHILFTSSEDLRLQNPARLSIIHLQSVSTEFFHKRWLYDDSWSARTRSKLTLTNLRPRGNKGPKLTWQGAWHENTKGTAQMRSFFVNVDERVWSWGVLVRRTSRPTYWGDVCWKGRGWEHMIMYCTFAWRGWGNSAYPTWWPVIGEDSKVHLRHRSGPLGLDFWKRRNKSRSGKPKLRTGGKGKGGLPNTLLKQNGLQLAQASFRHKSIKKAERIWNAWLACCSTPVTPTYKNALHRFGLAFKFNTSEPSANPFWTFQTLSCWPLNRLQPAMQRSVQGHSWWVKSAQQLLSLSKLCLGTQIQNVGTDK